MSKIAHFLSFSVSTLKHGPAAYHEAGHRRIDERLAGGAQPSKQKQAGRSENGDSPNQCFKTHQRIH
jgi:hypothetical protein